MKAIFSSVFETDFTEIIAYYASEVTPALSIRFEKSVVAAFEQIVRHPEIGRRRKELAHPEIRSFPVTGFENYAIFYQVRKKEVFFARLLHGARDLSSLL